jgi:hypothetical protein
MNERGSAMGSLQESTYAQMQPQMRLLFEDGSVDPVAESLPSKHSPGPPSLFGTVVGPSNGWAQNQGTFLKPSSSLIPDNPSIWVNAPPPTHRHTLAHPSSLYKPSSGS